MKEFCKQCRHVQFKSTMKLWPIQKQIHRTAQKHTEHKEATDIQTKTIVLVVFGFLRLVTRPG